MKILFINIADDGNGLGKKSVAALKVKYPENQGHAVKLVELMADALEFRTTGRLSVEAGRAIDSVLAEDDINEYDRIYIGAHGLIEDVNSCYCEIFGEGRERALLNHEQLANFFVQCLRRAGLDSDTEKQTNLVFAICYAARTAEYERDHIEEPINFSQTFAYSFMQDFNRLTTNQHKLTLASYTGAVGFNEYTGELTVETEEHIRLARREREFQIELNEAAEELEQQGENYNIYLMNPDSLETTERSILDVLYTRFKNAEAQLTEIRTQSRQPEYGRIVLVGADRTLKIDESGKRGVNQQAQPPNDTQSVMAEGCIIFSLTKK